MGDEKLVQLYGGFLANASDDSNKKTESVSGKQKTKKTNKKKGSSAEQGGENATGNGKRGRPRVDRRTDESAVEVCFQVLSSSKMSSIDNSSIASEKTNTSGTARISRKERNHNLRLGKASRSVK